MECNKSTGHLILLLLQVARREMSIGRRGILCGRGGNRRFCVALAVSQTMQYIHLQAFIIIYY